MKLHTKRFSAVIAICAALVACGGGGEDAGSARPMGTMRVALTDAPACGFDQVNVTVEKVRVHSSSAATDGDNGWSEVVLNPAKRVDLLDLQNGVLEELGQTALPAGRYQQLRLVLAENSATAPLANSVVPTGGVETALDTPSAQQSGLKMNVDLEVAAGQLLDLVLDFDACRSVLVAGASSHYKLKPVVSVIPRLVSGVSGALATAWPRETTQVSLQQAGSVVKAAAPDANGNFLLQPVPAGVYNLVIASPGKATVVVTDVAVADDAVTALNTAASAIDPVASATGVVDGTVDTGAATVDATTRVRQALTGGKTIELASEPVDTETGEYAHLLSVGAPLVGTFSSAGVLVFSADTAAAGKFSVQALAGGATKSSGVLGVAPGSTVSTDFTFP
jgi:hypothetical protein